MKLTTNINTTGKGAKGHEPVTNEHRVNCQKFLCIISKYDSHTYLTFLSLSSMTFVFHVPSSCIIEHFFLRTRVNVEVVFTVLAFSEKDETWRDTNVIAQS